jgi:hypothetical protein
MKRPVRDAKSKSGSDKGICAGHAGHTTTDNEAFLSKHEPGIRGITPIWADMRTQLEIPGESAEPLWVPRIVSPPLTWSSLVCGGASS